MQVDRPRAQLAASWKAQPCAAAASQDGPHKNTGGPHFPHQIVWNGVAGQLGGIDLHRVTFPFGFASQFSQNADGRIDIRQPGTIMYHTFACSDQGGGKDGQRAVFGSLYADRPAKAGPAFDYKLRHTMHPFA